MFVCPECGQTAPGAGFCTEHGAPLAPAHDPLLGQTVKSFRIARAIGQGGMGRVYLAVQPSIGSRVAVKVLSGECSGRRELVERFFAEARAVNVIRHESIVTVTDLDVLSDGRPYIIMEYLDGAPLSRVLERGPMPIDQAVRAITEVLDGLEAAHARGIVHRDLKPDNVFITTGGRAKILDFGVAKLRPDVSALSAETRTGALVGTPHYMSPEQARGQPVDARSDVYSAGLILFEAITGRRAFDADALFDLLRLHVEAPAPSLSTLRADVPPALETAVARALAKDPAERFPSARAFQQALLAALPLGASTPGSRIVLPSAPEIASPARHAPLSPVAPTHPGYVQSLVTAPPAPAPSHAFRWALLGAGTLVALAAIVGVVVVVFALGRDASPSPVVVSPPVPSAPDPPSTPPARASLAGDYIIESAKNPAGKGTYTGSVSITERGRDHYGLEWTIPGSPSYRGVGLREGSVLGVAWGAGNDYGVIVYRVDGGKLEGRWALAAAGPTGSERLTGPSTLGGAYRIIDGVNPNGTRYVGSVQLRQAGDVFRMRWKTGHVEYAGLGLVAGSALVVGWNPNRGTGVLAYRIEGDRLIGRWAEPGTSGLGEETLKRR